MGKTAGIMLGIILLAIGIGTTIFGFFQFIGSSNNILTLLIHLQIQV